MTKEVEMGVVDEIRELNLDPDSMVKLFFEDDGEEVNYRRDVDYHGIACGSDLFNMVAELVATKDLKVYSRNSDIDVLTDMRDRGYLEDYDVEDEVEEDSEEDSEEEDEDDFGFDFDDDEDEWLAEYIEEQFRDWEIYSDVDVFDYREKRYDYSRGHVYPQAELYMTVEDFLKHWPSVGSPWWEITVTNNNGRQITFSKK